MSLPLFGPDIGKCVPDRAAAMAPCRRVSTFAFEFSGEDYVTKAKGAVG